MACGRDVVAPLRRGFCLCRANEAGSLLFNAGYRTDATFREAVSKTFVGQPYLGAHHMPIRAASIRLANARKRIDNMLAKARARVDKILAKRPTGATSAHADRLHRLVDVVDAQAVREPTRDDATDAVAPDKRLLEAANQSVAASQPETVPTPIGNPLSRLVRP
jgi:hypothetical protein